MANNLTAPIPSGTIFETEQQSDGSHRPRHSIPATDAILSLINSAVLGLLRVNTVVSGVSLNRSDTIKTGGTAQVLMVANPTRRGFNIQNQSNQPLYICVSGTAAPDNKSIILNPGDFYESSPSFVNTGIISIYGPVTGAPFYASEF